ncbi:extracellular solute-binding protein [Seminavis robusta]|uniref:Extracellular solute-binding protein n=1 Tax=Seminavis robusta TaxID=568900 RepID=A0A9N8E492_9STRA|nr:extracellular solute-binding protein [Seminavis robusta]|eukprot:Sro649_g181140.1 extracellular solute-binding protein (1004) ;mRNA; f:7055-10166
MSTTQQSHHHPGGGKAKKAEASSEILDPSHGIVNSQKKANPTTGTCRQTGQSHRSSSPRDIVQRTREVPIAKKNELGGDQQLKMKSSLPKRQQLPSLRQSNESFISEELLETIIGAPRAAKPSEKEKLPKTTFAGALKEKKSGTIGMEKQEMQTMNTEKIKVSSSKAMHSSKWCSKKVQKKNLKPKRQQHPSLRQSNESFISEELLETIIGAPRAAKAPPEKSDGKSSNKMLLKTSDGADEGHTETETSCMSSQEQNRESLPGAFKEYLSAPTVAAGAHFSEYFGLDCSKSFTQSFTGDAHDKGKGAPTEYMMPSVLPFDAVLVPSSCDESSDSGRSSSDGDGWIHAVCNSSHHGESGYDVEKNRPQLPPMLPEHSVRTLLKDEDDENGITNKRTLLGVGLLMVALIVVLAVLLPIFAASSSSSGGASNTAWQAQDTENKSISGSPMTSLTTLQKIRIDGILKCTVGWEGEAGAATTFEGPLTRFEEHLCLAIGAALNVTVEFVRTSGNVDRFAVLANKTVDIASRVVTHTMQRQFQEPTSQRAFAFTVPYLYSGMQAGGDPTMVFNCAEKDFLHTSGGCEELRVCVMKSTSHLRVLKSMLPVRRMHLVLNEAEMFEAFMGGLCNVMAHEGHILAETVVRQAGYTGDYVIGDTLFTKEPLALVMRNDDAEFSDFVNAILMSLMVAELHSTTVFPTTISNVYPLEDGALNYQDAFRAAVGVGGNYGELFDRILAPYLQRQVVNQVRTFSKDVGDNGTGLLYAHPFGLLDVPPDNITYGPTLTTVLRRGYLRCGVIAQEQPGLAWWDDDDNNTVSSYVGMDTDYCKAMAASLFHGAYDSLEFVRLTNISDGAVRLHRQEVDVVAGAAWTLETDVREPTTGIGYSFSQPYFFSSNGEGNDSGAFCLMTRQDDHEWASLAYWTVAATVFAEEEGITSAVSIGMPEVLLFGERFKRLFRDVILSVGNYGEIYERNMEAFLPRQSPNTLNKSPNQGPQHFPAPGFLSLL